MLAGVVIAVVAGCSPGETGGDPRPATSEARATSESAEPTESKPSRPKEIKLDGVQPCSTLTTAQQGELKIDEARDRELDVLNNGEPAPTCRFRANGATLFSYNVSLVVGEGIEYWEGGSNLDVDAKTVAGFAAYQYKLSGTSEGYCSYAVDVADKEQVIVQFLPIGEGFTQDQMCQNAAKGAESVLATLQTLK
ncbi:hypothetical protein ADK67_00590 [Saccharothrix sp. NRRL B-16348]|uniref:DUF3558 domain-containing protein n=1 Tax=Saccharothrix sp. NRRL B-16348 TaxID=1415542 RepID=UPI0006B00D5E|nr:DUF3558 domain-containing protein [Saccharothrix sp. NRRL B-16348]KOX35056.1 hypothetical protein ADK67_00590 [Saccharothrix sp. NRRL B-16348]